MVRDWIVGALGDAAAYDRLARGMAGTELWSLLLEVVRERARARGPAELRAQYRRDRFVRPSPIDLRTAVELDGHLLAAADEFEAIELSPVAPLGVCSTIAVTDQHRVLTALRGTEVVSDPTNVLAVESAERLAAQPAAVVRLASSQRVIRAQELPKQPGFAQHFRIFVLTSAGRETADHGVAAGELLLHIRTMLRALDRLEAHGYHFGARKIDVLATPAGAPIADRVAAALTELPAERKPLEHPYYSGGVRYMLWVHTPDGRAVPLIDGGLFDWLARLTGNKRLVFVATGAGAQLMPTLFRTRP